jgi:predicted nucleic acid-binding protein
VVICVDASVAIRWVVTEDDSETALRLLEHLTARRDEWTAPALFFAEVTNILHRKVDDGAIEATATRAALDALLALPIRLAQGPDLVP